METPVGESRPSARWERVFASRFFSVTPQVQTAAIFSRQNNSNRQQTAAADPPPPSAVDNPITSVSQPSPLSRVALKRGAPRSVLETICCCLWSSSNDDGRAEAMLAHDSEMRRRQQPLLGEVAAKDAGKKCLVLDLDETLVHSSFRAMPNADYVIPVRIDDVVHQVYVCKRPGVDEFLKRMAAAYEVVLYTASLNKYADPLIDMLDPAKARARARARACPRARLAHLSRGVVRDA